MRYAQQKPVYRKLQNKYICHNVKQINKNKENPMENLLVNKTERTKKKTDLFARLR